MNGIGNYYLLKVRYGNSRHLNLTVTNADGTEKDMSAETVRMVIYDDSTRIATLTDGDGLTVTLGNIAVAIPATITALLKSKSRPRYEIEFATTDVNSPCLLYGDIEGIGGNV